ncbi:glycosyltransferase [Mycobacterium kubicae]|uniref:glycosyltransferase n=1 Tax=Mycobacterium kubicae TaxID=120959 RepID=UPI0007FD3EBD|nr:glycosyltransferase [Mycobacterium kubicae]OBF19147.1 glycosyltransferase [Mycobacterium kubicae]QNI05033.1 glycosyltransferase [Mycobacterium kubicae]
MKVVVVSYGSRGDVEPCAALGRELLHRGHQVQMTVPPNLLKFVESAGLTAVAYGPDSREQLNPASELVRDLATKPQNWFDLLGHVIQHVSEVDAEKSATLTSLADGADLLVSGFNEQGLTANVAEYYGIPFAALHYFPERLWASGGPATVIAKHSEDAQRRALGLPETSKSAAQRMAESGILEVQAYDEICLPGRAAEWVSPEARRPFVGALTLELPTDADEDVLSWIAADAPPIYFGFGSTPLESAADTVHMISTACRKLNQRALICSAAEQLADFPRSDHVKIVAAVNHAVIFPACRAVVHHGGAGTTAAAMRAGIPMLIHWLWLDQPMWAAAVTQLGVGTGRPFGTATEESLIADLTTILTPQYAERARALAPRLTAAATSATHTADLLQRIALP